MFKKCSPFELRSALPLSHASLESAMQAKPFVPTTPNQEESHGWMPVRAEEAKGQGGEDSKGGEMLLALDGHWFARFGMEHRRVNSAKLKDETDKAVQAIQEATGRVVGKKERRQIQDEVRQQLLPHAPTKRTQVMVWIDTREQKAFFDATVGTQVDTVSTALIQIAGPEVTLAHIQTATSAQGTMAHWLMVEAIESDKLELGRSVELQAQDELKTTVRYSNFGLECEEVRAHVQAGRMPTKLDLEFGANLSVTLDTGLRLRSIKLDFGSGNQGASRNPGDLDANLLVMANELRAFYLELIQALEGAAMAKQDRQGMQDLEAPDFLATQEKAPFRHRQRHALLRGKLRILNDLIVRISTKTVQHGGGFPSH